MFSKFYPLQLIDFEVWSLKRGGIETYRGMVILTKDPQEHIRKQYDRLLDAINVMPIL